MYNKLDDKVPDFLLSPGYRLCRHLILQGFVFLISLNIFWDAENEMIIGRVGVWFVYFLLLDAIVYFNSYVLFPRLLLKDKILRYTLSVAALILVSVFGIGLLQSVALPAGEDSGETGVSEMLMGITSSALTLGFFIAGISTLLFFKRRMEQSRRIEELKSATLQSELKYLKSQINPHFLFNMLNSANIMLHEDTGVASHILMKLNDLLRYQINDSVKDRVRLGEDVAFLNDFLELEKTRRDRFDYTLTETVAAASVQIPPLLFIPFVENAVKHSLDSENSSYVHIKFEIQGNQLLFACQNSKPANPVKKSEGGLGLSNIKRRLDLLFGDGHSLELQDEETCYTVNLQIKI
jgi:signal transduction histidine kinase